MQPEALIEEIQKLKEKQQVVILAHNYEPPEIQDIADITGDSLGLSIQAAETDARVIIFCGVLFMAESAAILSPDKQVILPRLECGCGLADMATPEQLKAAKQRHPDAVVVTYVNSSAAVKAESDICCTSSNAVKIVKSIPNEQTILFVPDQNLGTYAAQQTGRNIIVWKGFCNVHHINIKVEDVDEIRKKYPGYTLLVHPECIPEVFKQADVVASTKGMADFTGDNDNVIIGTEIGLFEQLKAKYPEKNIVPLSEKAICKNMKKTTLKDVLKTLETERNEISIEKEIAAKAVDSINRMLELS